MSDTDPRARASRLVGSWELVRPLGEGGMGEVWLAERSGAGFRQRGALKLIKRGMDTELVLSRFRRERQVLAQLTHPCIPRLLDGGASDDGRPFLVMEHVEGVPIDVFVRERGLDVRARLKLFLAVCDALQHAHERGVIHRDLKPANILVTGEAEPRLLDFGIAKLIEDSGDDIALDLTRTGQHHLTPRYASPEQVRGEAVTARSDVYALGLLLWELLVGRPAVALDGLTLLDHVEAICEHDIPRPSSAVESDATALRRTLSGDLDTICAMALRKEPERRYASAQQFAEDVRRHLEARPVLARPDTLGYRVSRFVRRHRVLVGSTTAVITALAVGLALALLQYRTALRASVASERSAYVASIEAAEAALRAGDTSVARTRLDAAPEGLRGWEWRHLASRLENSLYTSPPFSSFHHLRSIAWLDEETIAYSDAADLVVRDREREHLRIPDALPRGITFARRSNRLAWCDAMGAVWVLNAAAGLASRRCWIEPAPAPTLDDTGIDLQWSPDERWLAYSDARGLRILDGASGALLHEFPDEEPGIMANRIEWHPGGELLARSRWEETVQVFDVARGERVAEWRAHTMSVQDLAFDASGELLATTSLDRTVKVWDFAARRLLASLRLGQDLSSVTFAPGGEELLCGSSNGGIQRVAWRDNEARGILVGHTQPVDVLALSPDGTRLASAGSQDGLRIWAIDATDVLEARTCEFVNSIRPSPDGAHFATSSPDGFVRIWRTDTCRVEREVNLGRGYVLDVDWSRDGRFLVSAHAAGTVAVWSALDLSSPVHTFEPDPGQSTNAVVFAPDGSAVTSLHARAALDTFQLRVWSLESGGERLRFEHPALSYEGQNPLITYEDGSPRLLVHQRDAPDAWDRSGELQWALPDAAGPCVAIAATPGLERLALAFADELAVLDFESLEVLARWPITGVEPRALAWHPDGTRIALATRERIEIWDPRVPLRVALLQGHQGSVYDLCWTPDGSSLLSVSADGCVRVWRSR